ncbi:kinase-like protein [Gonapodya prolifera JEL478]|uniref:Kinase-like protein n=1 Tax=Gonapodya prolifera (strain JEL478) TaxID=1344416 RepID=A0A139ASG7_GONPJ|nr:kinase-like protein [Gonapodya prolifera JEL478]|eukprot:KXS19688.1 kinase-like protein [Gonapodya prolifera JEL478]
MPPAPAPLPRQWAIKESDVEIGRLIAQGGFGQVLEGMWLGHTKVAVKRLLIKPGRDVMSDIEREVTAWSALRHPNVLPFFGACVEAPLPWMISPFMERGNVLHYLSTFEDGPGDDLRLSLIYDISKGMQYLHSQKVIHSDLKSVNVLVSNDGAALVTDFGFVRVRSKTRSTLSKNMNVPGTFQWMPPERHRDGTCDEKGDVYAFAMMCVEIWTLDVPFGTIPDSPFLYHRIVNEGFRPDLSSIDMPEALKSLLRECWDQRPEARPTFSAIAERLKAIATRECRIAPTRCCTRRRATSS